MQRKTDDLLDEPAPAYTIDNTRPRTDTEGKIVNAHQGHITQFPDGRYYWVGSAWVPCTLKQGIDGCHVGTTRDMTYGSCGFGNNNISIYSNDRLANDGWRLETDDALPRATRLTGGYWQPNFEFNPATKLYVMWWIYSKPNTTVGLVQSGTSPRPGGPWTIANANVSLAHRSFTSAELFVDRDPSLPATSAPAAYLVYSSRPMATVVDRLDANWTSSVRQTSGRFGAGEGQVMLRWGSGSSTIYYVLAGSTGGCCFCPVSTRAIILGSTKRQNGLDQSSAGILCKKIACDYRWEGIAWHGEHHRRSGHSNCSATSISAWKTVIL